MSDRRITQTQNTGIRVKVIQMNPGLRIPTTIVHLRADEYKSGILIDMRHTKNSLKRSGANDIVEASSSRTNARRSHPKVSLQDPTRVIKPAMETLLHIH